MAERFTWTTDAENDVVVVRAYGDLDMAVAPLLSAHLDALLEPAAIVVLDCTGITFCDASGVHVLLRAHRWACQRRCVFALAAIPNPLSRVLELVDVLDLLVTVSTVQQATNPLHRADIRAAAPGRKNTFG